MDPQVAWEEMLEALATGDLFEADIRAEGLIDWLDRDGFAPQTLLRLLPDEWDRLICRYLCRKIMLAAQSPGK